MKRKHIFIGALIVAGLVLSLFGLQKDVSAIPESKGDAENDFVAMNDQGSGNKMIVTEASLTKGGFIILHKDVSDFPMDILGISEYIEPGTYSNLPVFLAEKGVSGDSIFAVLHEDDGDTIFNPEFDFSMLDQNNRIIMSKFTIE